VISLEQAVGATVAEGDALIILEAMKMNTTVSSPVAGKITSIHVKSGDTVEEGQLLVVIE